MDWSTKGLSPNLIYGLLIVETKASREVGSGMTLNSIGHNTNINFGLRLALWPSKTLLEILFVFDFFGNISDSKYEKSLEQLTSTKGTANNYVICHMSPHCH